MQQVFKMLVNHLVHLQNLVGLAHQVSHQDQVDLVHLVVHHDQVVGGHRVHQDRVGLVHRDQVEDDNN
jgi:hypothetical protein